MSESAPAFPPSLLLEIKEALSMPVADTRALAALMQQFDNFPVDRLSLPDQQVFGAAWADLEEIFAVALDRSVLDLSEEDVVAIELAKRNIGSLVGRATDALATESPGARNGVNPRGGA